MFVKQTSHPAIISRAYGFELSLSAPLLLLGLSHTLGVYKDYELIMCHYNENGVFL